MTVRLDATRVRAILLDIEGTTTPVEFVYQVLFPYARRHVRGFIQAYQDVAEVRADIEALRKEHSADREQKLNPPAWQEDSIVGRMECVVAYVHWLMDRDRKSAALKALQGKIWEAGYRTGELRGEVYGDVPPAFSRWREQKVDICIFSSGSVLAQKLLFKYTTAGDLTTFIREYFDTSTGAKNAVGSYRSIAKALALPSSGIVFVSDIITELDAARLAGMETALCVRPGRPKPQSTTHPVLHAFDEISFEPGLTGR